MGYKKSRQRIEFDLWIIKTTKVVRAGGKKKYSRLSINEYMLCSTLVLSYARFQNYITDSVMDFCSYLNSRNLSVKELPSAIPATHFIKFMNNHHVKSYYINGDEKESIRHFSKSIVEKKFEWSNHDYVGVIDQKAIIASEGYPSTDNINIIYNRIGIENVFMKLNKFVRGDSKLLIKEINDLRCEMAHFGIPATLNSNDILDKLKKLNVLVSGLDRIIHHYRATMRE